MRELKLVLEVALVLAEGEPITAEHLGPDLALPKRTEPEPQAPLRENAEKGALTSALEKAGGNLTRAASLLGVARTTLYRMLERHGLKR
ncbi:MAG TPA: helix-turn-helix domain-containing protein [Myxococcota bacterium]|nr:helix-turn-helix domain-containing protein [Myxococcota bacterium]